LSSEYFSFPKTFWLFAGLFLVLNFATINNGHNWGGDFSQYIRHAQNLLEQQPYNFTYDLEPKVVSPPGLPLLIAPILRFFGLNFAAMKMLNVVFLLLFVAVSFKVIARAQGEDIALLSAVFLFSLPYFFLIKHEVLTDIPFLFFTAASLWLGAEYFERKENYSRRGRCFLSAVFLLFMASAFLLRWVGVTLFAAAAVAALFRHKERPVFYWGLALASIALLAWEWRLGVSAGYHFQENAVALKEWWGFYLTNIDRFLKAALILLFPIKTAASVLSFQTAYFILIIWKLIFAVLFAWLLRQAWVDKENAFINWFAAIYLASLTLWLVPGELPRYLLPLMLPFLLLSFRFLRRGKMFFSGILCLLILHNVICVSRFIAFNDDVIMQPATRQMQEWVRSNTDRNARFMFKDPRVLGLLTDRKGAAFLINAKDELNQRIRELRIQYLVLEKMSVTDDPRQFNREIFSWEILRASNPRPAWQGTEFLLAQIDPSIITIEQVWENNQFRVFQVVP